MRLRLPLKASSSQVGIVATCCSVVMPLAVASAVPHHAAGARVAHRAAPADGRGAAWTPRRDDVPEPTAQPQAAASSGLPASLRRRPHPGTQQMPAPAAPAADGVPALVLSAYRQAAAAVDAGSACNIDWTVLAGIGRIESDHARDGGSGASGWNGTARPPIIGPVLDGAGYLAVPDTDHGRLDGDPRWDHAVGPMQFLPATWAAYGADGNGDGVADPENIFDAALAAAHYLCSGFGDLRDGGHLRAAVTAYNPSAAYVQAVVTEIAAYRHLPPPGAASTRPAAQRHPRHRVAGVTCVVSRGTVHRRGMVSASRVITFSAAASRRLLPRPLRRAEVLSVACARRPTRSYQVVNGKRSTRAPAGAPAGRLDLVQQVSPHGFVVWVLAAPPASVPRPAPRPTAAATTPAGAGNSPAAGSSGPPPNEAPPPSDGRPSGGGQPTPAPSASGSARPADPAPTAGPASPSGAASASATAQPAP